MEISDLTAVERRVWDAFPSGVAVDLRNGEDEDEHGAVPEGDRWGPERTVRGEVLRALVISGASAEGAIAGLRLVGARIVGRLDLTCGTVDGPVRLLGCHFDEPPELSGARTRTLDFTGSRLPGLRADEARVDGALRLSRCHIAGQVTLSGARIGNSLFLDRTRVRGPIRLDGIRIEDALAVEGAQLTVGEGEVSLRAVNASVGGGVVGKDLTARGTVLLTGLRVGGTLNLEGSHLVHPGGEALAAAVMTVDLDVLCNGLRAQGEVRLTRSRIGGRLNLTGARIANPGHAAVQLSGVAVGAEVAAADLHTQGQVKARGAKITGALVLTDARLSHPGGAALLASNCTAAQLWLDGTKMTEGHLSLRGSTFTTVHAHPETFPAQVWLDGLTYQALSPRLPPRQRLAPLQRDGDGYVPHSYEQLATAYQRVGDETAARTVRLAKQRHHRSTQPGYARLWGYLQDATVGYGFRPVRAAGWLLTLLLLGALAFGLHHPVPTRPGEGPTFQPLVYALDLLLPVVDFGQEKAFQPQGWYQWLAYLLIALGWVLATTVITGITRAVSRQ
ncbi:membrane-associated oxidoreductase [Streptomyces sp. WZ-12]|uniref:membrane-associated oxidoreductase n=1 Tax=Streptomyces sp. WZ-12 TaxID=3030210 RepID=UPI002380F4A4|nr:membrane-associated oxidoreductase [Streptomyces sp. WZ-12]